MLRARLERETGPVDQRVREAIAVANNEIHRAALSRADWNGMACVLTVAVIKDGVATVGHVGDTRLYKIRDGRLVKITRDHSPVGEREDAGELSESEAMRHPRRNEVYRDVGSELHDPGDPDFVDIVVVPVEADAALLLCSDGLSDLVPAGTIAAVAKDGAGDPERVVGALIEAANRAGGKDNVTAVYVEGEQYARRGGAQARRSRPRLAAPRRGRRARPCGRGRRPRARRPASGGPPGRCRWRVSSTTSGVLTVGPTESIAAAIAAGGPRRAGRRRAGRVPRAAGPERGRTGGQPRAEGRDAPDARHHRGGRGGRDCPRRAQRRAGRLPDRR